MPIWRTYAMLKGYEAIYNEGRVEWIGAAPRCAHAHVLVVIEEGATEQSQSLGMANGNLLADIIEKWDEASRRELVEKFGNPLAWQQEQRMERIQPGRESA